MLAPKYYPGFKCLADRCTHSCCIGWEIDIDEGTLAAYDSLEGPLGEQIRCGIARGEQGACFALDPAERCPNLDENGLCRIISTIGEAYLCDICREHPRFYHEICGKTEVGLGAACEAAAALILREPDYLTLICVEEEECAQTVCDFDIFSARQRLWEQLADQSIPYPGRLQAIAQRFDLPAPPCAEAHRALFDRLEYLDPAHKALLADSYQPPCPDEEQALLCERMLAYLIYRHVSVASDEQALRRALALCLFLERVFRALLCRHRLSAVQSAVMLSEELEYSELNTETIALSLMRA